MSVPAIINTKSAKKAAKSTADYAAQNTKTLLVLAALGLGVYTVWKIKKGIDSVGSGGGIFDTGSSNPASTPNTTPGNTPVTITQNQAAGIATILFAAMDGAGTDTDSIFTALHGRTPADFHLISQAFGTPRYGGYGEGAWPMPKRNLMYWLNAELDSDEMSQLRNIMPGIF